MEIFHYLTLSEISKSFNEFTFIVLTIGAVIVHAVVVAHILLNKHEESASAILWIIVVINFPIIGIIFYLLFGINRINTIGIKIMRANKKVDEERNESDDAAALKYFSEQRKHTDNYDRDHHNTVNFNRTLDRLLPECPPIKGNKLELLKDGTMAYPKMLEAIKNAKKSIHLQSFIIMGDDTGSEIFDALEEKARQGVQVKVLYDKFGSSKAIFSHFFNKYAQKIPNLEILPFMRINLLAPWRIQLRNHRKLLVVDGRVGFIGGINISSENVRRHTSLREEYIHDLHCKVHGPAVGELQLSFMRDWSFASKMPPNDIFTEEYFPEIEECGNSIMRVVYTGPGQNPSASEKVYFTAAATAQKYIWIMTPYFVPDKPFIRALKMAEARGVDVRIIVPKNNNHWYVDYACKSLYRTLLESGVRIFEKTGTFSHVKAMIVDGEWGQMGSSNCDVRSFKLNFELDFAVYCGQFMGELHEQFEEELAESEEVFLNSVLRKKKQVELVENLCSLLTPVL